MGVLTSNPWENAWIIIGLIIASIAGVSLVFLGGVGLSRSGFLQWVFDSSQQIFLYAPNALLFFGFMSDIVNQEVNRSVASISGLIGVILTFLLGKIRLPTSSEVTYTPPSAPTLPGGPLTAEPPDTNPFRGGANPLLCTIPGLDVLENNLAPQSLIMSVSILFYYLLQDWTTNPTQSISLSVTASVLIISQIASLFMNDCLGRFRFSESSKVIPVVIAIVLGVAYGGIVYSVWDKIIVPKIQASGQTVKSGPLQTKNDNPISIGKPGEQVSADLEDGDYELVGELFKDGELITSSIVD